MDIDLPYLLFWAVCVSGLIIMTDLLFLKSRREKSALIGFVAEEKTDKNEKATVTRPKLVEYAYSFFPVLLLVFVLRGFVAEPYQIPSESMVPTLEVGDFILVSKYAYGLRMPVLGTKLLDVDQPKRGEMMVFVPPHDPRYFIKRVVGVPGDRIRYASKSLFINGERLPYQFVKEFPDPRFGIKVMEYEEKLGAVPHLVHKSPGYEPTQEWIVGEGEYLMMGDNRDRSEDSRSWGMASEANIVGKAIAIWLHKEPGWNLPNFSRNRWFEYEESS